jgi:hypothetical protein
LLTESLNPGRNGRADASIFKPKSWLEAENAALRQQPVVLHRQLRGRVQFTNSDHLEIRDGDKRGSPRRLRAMGIRDKPIAPGASRMLWARSVLHPMASIETRAPYAPEEPEWR